MHFVNDFDLLTLEGYRGRDHGVAVLDLFGLVGDFALAVVAQEAVEVLLADDAAESFGRKRSDLKVFPGVTIIVDETDEAAKKKLETLKQYRSPEGALALFSGWIGVDLAMLPSTDNIGEMKTDAIQGLLSALVEVDPNREWTLKEIGEHMSIGSLMPKIVGSPTSVADELERWMEETDCDGFNLVPVTQPTGFSEFVDMVVPELQRPDQLLVQNVHVTH